MQTTMKMLRIMQVQRMKAGENRFFKYVFAAMIMLLAVFTTISVKAQQQGVTHFNNTDASGVILDDYDPVAFFTDNKPVKGAVGLMPFAVIILRKTVSKPMQEAWEISRFHGEYKNICMQFVCGIALIIRTFKGGVLFAHAENVSSCIQFFLFCRGVFNKTACKRYIDDLNISYLFMCTYSNSPHKMNLTDSRINIRKRYTL